MRQNNQLSQILHALMPHWIIDVGLKTEFPAFMKTRYAVTVAKLFKITYLHAWNSFFAKLFSILQLNQPEIQNKALDYFLKILKKFQIKFENILHFTKILEFPSFLIFS